MRNEKQAKNSKTKMYYTWEYDTAAHVCRCGGSAGFGWIPVLLRMLHRADSSTSKSTPAKIPWHQLTDHQMPDIVPVCNLLHNKVINRLPEIALFCIPTTCIWIKSVFSQSQNYKCYMLSEPQTIFSTLILIYLQDSLKIFILYRIHQNLFLKIIT